MKLLNSTLLAAAPYLHVVAGPVNNPSSFPAAYVNELGSTLAIGDLKVLISWVPVAGDEDARDSATLLRMRSSQASSTEDTFTGGIASASALSNSTAVAVACSDIETQVFTPARSPAYPGGSWTVLSPSPTPSDLIRRCAMTEDGTVAEYIPSFGALVLSSIQVDPASGNVVPTHRTINLGSDFIDNTPSLDLSAFIVASGDRVMVINRKNKAAIVQAVLASDLSVAQLVAPLNSPFGDLQPKTRFAANKGFILRADSGKVELASLATSTSPSSSLTVSIPRSLRISPCSDNEACGVSLSRSDSSWVVTGYWGTFVGQTDSNVPPKRISVPLGVETQFGTAIAHQGLGGIFLYLGADDGDIGHLPLSIGPSVDSTNILEKLWTVWKRRDEKAAGIKHDFSIAESDDIVVPLSSSTLVSPFSTLSSSTSTVERSLLMTVYRGELPLSIPMDWVHWEPAVKVKPPRIEHQERVLVAEGAPAPKTWWPEKIGVTKAWNLVAEEGITPNTVHVALIDSGVNYNHSWFSRASSPSFYHNPGEIPGNHLDDDNNGYADDVIGYDFVNESGDVRDFFGHGSMTSGLVVGRHPTDASFEFAPATNARMTMIRALGRGGQSNSIDLSRAIHYAVKIKAQVVSCSWGGGSDTQALRDSFGLMNAANTVIFSSAGNDGENTDSSGQEVPKNYPGVIAVGASTESDGRPRYSDYGAKTVRFFAPGDNVMSTDIHGGLSHGSGSSFASPVMAGAYTYLLGVILARTWEGADMAAVQQTALDVMCSTAIKKSSLPSVCGRISLDAAVAKALSFRIKGGIASKK